MNRKNIDHVDEAAKMLTIATLIFIGAALIQQDSNLCKPKCRMDGY